MQTAILIYLAIGTLWVGSGFFTGRGRADFLSVAHEYGTKPAVLFWGIALPVGILFWPLIALIAIMNKVVDAK